MRKNFDNTVNTISFSHFLKILPIFNQQWNFRKKLPSRYVFSVDFGTPMNTAVVFGNFSISCLWCDPFLNTYFILHNTEKTLGLSEDFFSRKRKKDPKKKEWTFFITVELWTAGQVSNYPMKFSPMIKLFCRTPFIYSTLFFQSTLFFYSTSFICRTPFFCSTSFLIKKEQDEHLFRRISCEICYI